MSSVDGSWDTSLSRRKDFPEPLIPTKRTMSLESGCARRLVIALE
jgi:hypothetical protein